jgi:hypothetical protein
MEKLLEFIKFLNNPYLVANVQTAFGIKLISVIESADEYKNGKGDVHKDKLGQVSIGNGKKCIYSIENKFFYWFFFCVTHIGNEVFYILFLPMLSWNYDYKTMYLTALSWSIVMYLGQATKDIIEMPRPRTPPVIKVEEKYLLGNRPFLFSFNNQAKC